MAYDCMKVHQDENGEVLYNEDCLAIFGPDTGRNIDNPMENSLCFQAKIMHDPVGTYLYGILLDGMGRYNEAYNCYAEAAEKGILGAMTNLALCYWGGNGVRKNVEKCVEWLEKAAKQGNPTALFKLGVHYDLGEYYPINPAKAAFYYEQAANCNHPIAQRNLAYSYLNGEGVEKNLEKATHWYKKAASFGERGSQAWCDENNISYSESSLIVVTKIFCDMYEKW